MKKMRSKPLTLISINLFYTIMRQCEICTRTLELFLKELPSQHQFSRTKPVQWWLLTQTQVPTYVNCKQYADCTPTFYALPPV